MSDDDIDESLLPDRETCDKLCQEFARVTNTDSACAQFFLQDRQWDLQRSINAYFKTKSSESQDNDDDDVEAELDVPKSLKLVSWNLDGLDEKSLPKRTKFVCQIINCELPDVVFFQEVIPETLSLIEKYLPAYDIFQGNDVNYFVVILTKRSTIKCSDHRVIPFATSVMYRNLLVVEGKISDIPLVLMTSHLESTKEHSDERIKQLRTVFKQALDACDQNTTVLVGGDFNMRDQELEKVGGIPAGLEDLWITCGSRPECRYTWDMTRNDNLIFQGRIKPRCRFDRLYMAPSSPARLKPEHFGLIGLERIKSCGRFPSDHWGLTTRFSLEN
uniref:Tyrosyl-DNA phosphodiesterase 2 n=1 Tax=Strigamia maritima TaxID=126957 RepID=T1IYM3_STRMM